MTEAFTVTFEELKEDDPWFFWREKHCLSLEEMNIDCVLHRVKNETCMLGSAFQTYEYVWNITTTDKGEYESVLLKERIFNRLEEQWQQNENVFRNGFSIQIGYRQIDNALAFWSEQKGNIRNICLREV